MFKPPKLKAYNKTDNIKAEILKNQIGILNTSLKDLKICELILLCVNLAMFVHVQNIQ